MLGSLISAGANLIGGLIGRNSTARANKENIAQQRDFAQNSVQWRVADANKAGVSPLVALGMSPMNFAPSSVGDTAMPSAFSAMGQDVGRAVAATSTAQDKMDTQVKMLTLTKMGLENDLLASQIRKLNQTGPAFPGSPTVMDGQGDVPVVDLDNLHRLVKPQRTPHLVRPGGAVYKTGLGSDAQSYEDRYAEFVSNVYGVANLIDDRFPWIRKVLNYDPIGDGRRKFFSQRR